MPEPKVFNIKKLTATVDGQIMTDLATDGCGMTPEAEASLIEGLYGEAGVNINPSTAATLTIALNSTSAENTFLNELFKTQQTGEKGAVKVEFVVDPDFAESFGYAKIGCTYCWIQKSPEYATNENEVITVEWTFIGYDYYFE